MSKEPKGENYLEIASGLLLLVLVLFTFIDVGTLIYSGVALLATVMLSLGFLYKLKEGKFDIVFFFANLISPVSLTLFGVLFVAGGGFLGGALGLLAGIFGSILGAIAGGLIASSLFYMIQAMSYLAYLLFGIIILLQGMNYLPVEERAEIKF